MIAIDHVNVRAIDQEAVRDFLIAALGAAEGPRPPFDFPGYWLYLEGRPVVHTSPRVGDARDGGWVDHIAFGPFAFAAAKAQLDASGLPCRISGIPGTAVRQLFVEGPEGLKLELNCPR